MRQAECLPMYCGKQFFAGLLIIFTVTACTKQGDIDVIDDLAKRYEQAGEADKAKELRDTVANLACPVVYALKDIPAGSMITADAIDTKKIPSSKIPQLALTSPVMAAGRFARERISAGEMICAHHLSAKGLTAAQQRQADKEEKAAEVKWPRKP